jgi:glycosyltransferase involved in cell wall biosynthesis
MVPALVHNAMSATAQDSGYTSRPVNVLTGYDVLCFSSSDWHGKWGSRQQVMMRFASRGHRVFFVEWLAGLEHFWKYSDLRQRRWQRWREGVREIKSNLWVLSPPPLFPGRYYSTAIARLNAALVCRWLAPYLRRLKIIEPVLWLYQPEHVALIGQFGERLAVYHCIDEFTAGTRGHKRQTITTLETDLLHQAHVVFANSILTYENKRKLNLNTYRIPSGADVEHFAQAANPAREAHPDVAMLPRPILVFVGNINEKIDVTLLATIAETRPHWSMVLIGQACLQSTDLRPIRRLANVHWLGKRPFETLPSLLRGADVCLLPYVQGEATRYRSPLKLYEYLATGKPIVSTEHPEVCDFGDTVAIASADRFVETIESVLQNDAPEDQKRRIEIAGQHSWDARVDRMHEILMRHLE